MASKSPDSSEDSPDTTFVDEPHARFFLQDIVEQHDIKAIDPTRASDYAKNRVAGKDGTRSFNKQLYDNNVFAYDAMIAGWVLFSPVTVTVESVDQNSYEITTPKHPDGAEVVKLTELGGDPVIEINTLWGIELPESYSALLTEPIVDTGVGVKTAPQHILQDNTTASLTITLRVEEEVKIERGDALAQLQAIDQPLVDASYRTITQEELDEIAKERRRRYLYPSTYPDSRETKRFGKLERQGDSAPPR